MNCTASHLCTECSKKPVSLRLWLEGGAGFYDKWWTQMNSQEKSHISGQKCLFRLFQYRVIHPFTMSFCLNQQQIGTHIKPCRWWRLNWVLKHEKELWKHLGRLPQCLQTYESLKKDDIFMNELSSSCVIVRGGCSHSKSKDIWRQESPHKK